MTILKVITPGPGLPDSKAPDSSLSSPGVANYSLQAKSTSSLLLFSLCELRTVFMFLKGCKKKSKTTMQSLKHLLLVSFQKKFSRYSDSDGGDRVRGRARLPPVPVWDPRARLQLWAAQPSPIPGGEKCDTSKWGIKV